MRNGKNESSEFESWKSRTYKNKLNSFNPKWKLKSSREKKYIKYRKK